MSYWTETEEAYKGFIIYIDENPDVYRGGYEFCISDGTGILNLGLTVEPDLALFAAQNWIDEYLDKASTD